MASSGSQGNSLVDLANLAAQREQLFLQLHEAYLAQSEAEGAVHELNFRLGELGVDTQAPGLLPDIAPAAVAPTPARERSRSPTAFVVTSGSGKRGLRGGRAGQAKRERGQEVGSRPGVPSGQDP